MSFNTWQDIAEDAIQKAEKSGPLTQDLITTFRGHGATGFQSYFIPLLGLAASLESRVTVLEGYIAQLNMRITELEREADGP